MAGTRKVYGAKEIGLRGTLLKAGPDGGIEIPHADVAEVAQAFGLSLEPPKVTKAPVAPQEPAPAAPALTPAPVAQPVVAAPAVAAPTVIKPSGRGR